jgi:hypothetical protein
VITVAFSGQAEHKGGPRHSGWLAGEKLTVTKRFLWFRLLEGIGFYVFLK